MDISKGLVQIADMATEIEAAQLLTFQAGDDKNQGKRSNWSYGKLFASEVCVKVANEAVQILGDMDSPRISQWKNFWDSKLRTIGEGTSEIQKLVISRDLLK